MQINALELRRFYHSKIGRIVRRILKKKINAVWKNIHDETIVGFGYSAPYLGGFHKNNHVFVLADENMGESLWQSKLGQRNNEAIIDPRYLPFRHEIVDKAILCHHLEHIDKIKEHLQELWHVMKPEGQAIIIVPNRHGLWAKAENTPFGHGAPFSESQIMYYVTDCGFVVESHNKDLFIPPSSSRGVMYFLPIISTLMRVFMPFLAGVHVIQIKKIVPAPIKMKTRAQPNLQIGRYLVASTS